MVSDIAHRVRISYDKYSAGHPATEIIHIREGTAMTNTLYNTKHYSQFLRIPVHVPEQPNVRKFIYAKLGIVYINLSAASDAKLIEYYP